MAKTKGKKYGNEASAASEKLVGVTKWSGERDATKEFRVGKIWRVKASERSSPKILERRKRRDLGQPKTLETGGCETFPLSCKIN